MSTPTSIPMTAQAERSRARIVWVVILSLLAALLGVFSAPSANAVGFSISGTITGAGSGPLDGAFACAYEIGGPGSACSGDTVNGLYAIPDLEAGTYTVSFQAPQGSDFISEYWDNESSNPTPLVVSSNVTADAELALGTHIEGTVLGAPDGVPLENASVSATSSDYSIGAFAETDADGNYRLSGLPAGSYRIRFQGPPSTLYLPEWWNDQPTLGTATVVAVSTSPITGLSTTLAPSGSISGNVKGLADANLDGASVSAWTTGGDFIDSAVTDSSGNYVFSGLAAGTYSLKFEGPIETSYLSEWWNDKATQDLADPVTVTVGAINTGKDAVLAPGGTITGNVKGAPSTNLSAANVSLYDANDNYVTGTQTNASGNYTISELPTGSYTLYFEPSATDNFIPEWWDDVATQASATYFAVTAGSTASGRDAVLASGATISGTVTGGSPSVGLPNIFVTAYDSVANSVGSATTNSSGAYIIRGVPAGSYTLDFLPDFDQNFVAEYWNNKSTYPSADYFTVAALSSVTGKDAFLTTGAKISGLLTDASGNPLNGAVAVYEATGTTASYGNLVATAFTGAGGAYTAVGLPVGSYRVGFTTNEAVLTDEGGLPSSDPYVSEWYSNKYSFSGSTTVTVTTAGQVVSGINGSLENPRFADVPDPSSTFYTFIEWMSAANISTGTVQPSGKPLYKPSDAVSRQAMALFLYRLSGDTTFVPPVTPTFADVTSASHPTFYKAIEWMYDQGISTGTAQPGGKPLYKPSDAVSRQAMALFIARYAGANLSIPPSIQRFADVPLTASSAAATDWMFANGISTGTAQPPGLPLYKPADPVTRQAMAAFLYRVNDLLTT